MKFVSGMFKFDVQTVTRSLRWAVVAQSAKRRRIGPDLRVKHRITYCSFVLRDVEHVSKNASHVFDSI